MYICNYLNRKVMTEIVLKNRVSKQKLHSIVTFFQALNIDAEIKTSHRKEVAKRQKQPFVASFGMWADRDVDARKMRQESYEKRTKTYNDVTL